MADCPYCGDDQPPVEGHCQWCGMRRGFPVPIPQWEGEPPQDQLFTDQDYTDTLEEPLV